MTRPPKPSPYSTPPSGARATRRLVRETPLPPWDEPSAGPERVWIFPDAVPGQVQESPPAPAPTPAQFPNPISWDAATAPPGTAAAPASILIATAEPGWAKTAACALRWQYRLGVVSTAEEALDLLHAQTPDLLLLDRSLPGDGAMQICHALAHSPALRTVTFLWLADRHTAEACAHADLLGAATVLTPPCSPTRLLLSVQSALARRAA